MADDTDQSPSIDEVSAEPSSDAALPSEDTDNTLENHEVQAEPAENSEDQGSEPSADPDTDTEELEEIVPRIERHLRKVNKDITWKEDLKLKAVEFQLNEAYYLHWSKEANLFVRRYVVIRKRMRDIQARIEAAKNADQSA